MTIVETVRSGRGRGGSEAVKADRLSQDRPLAALHPDLYSKCGVTARHLFVITSPILHSLAHLVHAVIRLLTFFWLMLLPYFNRVIGM